jgi:2-C-methyl-D-erythritol 4-phosphate cytidylyltransferase
VPLAGRPLVEWSIDALRAAGCVGAIVVACPPGRADDVRALVPRADGELDVVEGGATRAESVRNALATVGTDLVAIHDAARPLLTAELVEQLVDALIADGQADAAIAAAPVVDTIKRATGDAAAGRLIAYAHQGVPKASSVVEATVDRSRLWAAQTPQVFRTKALREAIEAYPAEAPEPTDEAMLIEAAGGRVLICPGAAENLKVTTRLDLRVAELVLADRAR